MSDRDGKAAEALDHGKLREGQSEPKAAIGPQPEAEYPKQRFAAGQIVETGLGGSHADAVATQDPTDRVAAIGSISDKTRSHIPGASMLTSDLVGRFAALSSVVDRARVDAPNATVLGSGVAQRFAELDALSGRAAALISAETFTVAWRWPKKYVRPLSPGEPAQCRGRSGGE